MLARRARDWNTEGVARAMRWLRGHRPEDLLLNGLLTVAILGALAVGYWAWRADSQAARPVVAGRVLAESPTSTRARATSTTATTAPAPPATAPPALETAPPPLLPDTGPAPTGRTRRRAPSGTVVTAPPQVLTSVPPTTPPATAPATTTTTRRTTTTTEPSTTTTTTTEPQLVGGAPR